MAPRATHPAGVLDRSVRHARLHLVPARERSGVVVQPAPDPDVQRPIPRCVALPDVDARRGDRVLRRAAAAGRRAARVAARRFDGAPAPRPSCRHGRSRARGQPGRPSAARLGRLAALAAHLPGLVRPGHVPCAGQLHSGHRRALAPGARRLGRRIGHLLDRRRARVLDVDTAAGRAVQPDPGDDLGVDAQALPLRCGRVPVPPADHARRPTRLGTAATGPRGPAPAR